MRRDACSRAVLKQLALMAFLVSMAVAGCAPREAPVVTAPAAPRFPEYVFPAADAADTRLLSEHQSAWYLLQVGDTRAAERRFTAALAANYEDCVALLQAVPLLCPLEVRPLFALRCERVTS